ncbi:SAF domain-containing protein [Egibacter rhizosphaerae]|uniref:SAF domain-containing protein n=1 Tax=Egibacter rhizosphaerae TaxID=1670831 RepID=UPI0013F1771B|nr:SAF domain-containing protein [Egibacter rhizosphaerae]
MGSVTTGLDRQSTADEVSRAGTKAARPLRRRRGLPGGRAVVGGFLVAGSAVGLFAAYLDATRGPVTQWAVAARDVAPGQELTTQDLGTVPIDLPEVLRSRSFSDAEALVGTIASAPLSEGELVQASHVVPADELVGRDELSFPVAADRAVAGSLEPGERIDVLVTSDDETEAVVRDVLLTGVGGAEGAVAGVGDELVVTVALDTPAETLAVTHAAGTGDITLVRATARELPDEVPARFAPDEGGFLPDARSQPELDEGPDEGPDGEEG